jgi:hypothetical protein
MNVRSLACLKHIFLRRVRSRIQQIIHDGRVEQHGILRHDTNISAQTVKFDIPQVMAINGNGTVCNVVEAEEKFERGGLSTTGLADNGCLCAGCNGKVYAVEDKAALLSLVSEFDVVEGNFALEGRKDDGIWLFDYTSGFFELFRSAIAQ